jgi:predicted transcriptional regulator
MSIRLRPATYTRLLDAAAERDVSANWLIQRAVDDFLARLIPPDEIVLTTPPAGREGQP